MPRSPPRSPPRSSPCRGFRPGQPAGCCVSPPATFRAPATPRARPPSPRKAARDGPKNPGPSLTMIKDRRRDLPQTRDMLGFLHRALFAVAVLAIAFYGMAATARGPMTKFVICGEGGSETVRLDSAGNPANDDTCCDCASCVAPAASLPPRADPAERPLHAAPMLRRQAIPHLIPATRHWRPMPRAPPSARQIGTITTKGRAAKAHVRSFSAPLEIDQVDAFRTMACGGQLQEFAP